LKVLAIDDSSTILELISTMLSTKGHEVETAKSGNDGLKKYSSFRPDVVTLDLSMPTMDGYETLSALKRLDKYANVIMLTAANHSAALQRCLREGAIDFVSKPFSASDIINAIDRAIGSPKYCNHDAAMFFSQVKNKLQNITRNSFSDDSSFELKSVQTVRDVSHTRGKHGDAQGTAYSPCEDDVIFITEITGEKDGMVMSLVKNGDLHILFDVGDADKGKVHDNVTEFFNMINMKVVSELANSIRSKVDGGPIMFFSNPHRMSNFWNETARMWTRIELGIFEINHAGNTIPLTIQIWCDGELFA
jgi:two-component system, chemotaxis family, chemotaxis protein CheY